MRDEIFEYYQNFKIFFTFLLIWISVQFGSIVEDYIGYILVISIGILHGANDLLILSIKEKVSVFNKKNLLIYIGIVIICFCLFFFEPFFTIILFILISSYHFGEEYFSSSIKINPFFNSIYFISYGLFLFSILFILTIEDVKIIMNELTGVSFTKNFIKITLVCSGVLFFLLSLFLLLKKKIESLKFFKEVFYLLLISLVFNTSSLILGFAIYFILWHSLPSILCQIEFISGDFSKKNIIFYLKKASIFWVVSLLGLFILYLFFNGTKLFNSLIFVILFAVTAPHIWVMYKMKS